MSDAVKPTDPAVANFAAASVNNPGSANAPKGLEGPEMERDVWSGRPSWKGFVPHFAGMIIWVAIISVLVVQSEYFRTGTTGPVVASVLYLVGLLFLGFKVVEGRYSLMYRLTTQRLHITKGLFARTHDQTDLLRVDDVAMTETFIQRLVGVGNVRVSSPSDKSDPETILANIDEPKNVAELINTNRIKRRRSGAVIVEGI